MLFAAVSRIWPVPTADTSEATPVSLTTMSRPAFSVMVPLPPVAVSGELTVMSNAPPLVSRLILPPVEFVIGAFVGEANTSDTRIDALFVTTMLPCEAPLLTTPLSRSTVEIVKS